MSTIVNPWELGEITTGMPVFTKGKFITLKITPPKGKTIRNGLVATLAMIAYENEGEMIETVSVTGSPASYHVEFPHGKRDIMATKYRGPKSWYRFRNNETGSFYTIGKRDPVTGINSRMTDDGAIDYLSGKITGWEGLSPDEQDSMIDDYFAEMYMFALAKDYNMDVEQEPALTPFTGMVTDFYRRYTPPKEGERWGNVVVTKFARQEGKETLSGDYTQVDAEIAATIYETLTTHEASTTSFDPASFVENSEDNDIM